MSRLLNPWLIGAALLAATTAFGADAPGNVDRGKAAFDRNCVACHGAGTIGGRLLPGTASLQAKYRGKEPAPLEQRTDLTAAYVMAVIRHGDEGMPFFRPTEVSNQDLRDIAAYLTRNNR
jgi:mono/diheme cytochrome c family protein